MTGRRLLDAAAILKVSQGVAAKHVALRQHQLGVYSKTSSLAEAVKSQTGRITLTVKAASILAERFNGPRFDHSMQASQPKDFHQRATTTSADKTLEKNGGFFQDYFDERSDQNASAEPQQNGNRGLKQENAKGYPLPDGPSFATETVEVPKRDQVSNSRLLPRDPSKAQLADERGEKDESLQLPTSGGSSDSNSAEEVDNAISEKAKVLQRQAKRQIPSQTAELPPAAHFEEPALRAGQDQDVFYEPSSSNGRPFSALPRVKFPKNMEDGQQNDGHLLDSQINQDVFYSSTPRSEEQPVPQAQAVPEQDQNSDESYTELFHSPRVARMLSGQPRPSQPSKGLEIPSAHETPVKQTKVPQEKDQVSFSIRGSGQESQDGLQSPPTSIVDSKPSRAEGSEDAHELAADMAKDAKTMSVDSSQVRRLRDMSITLVLID